MPITPGCQSAESSTIPHVASRSIRSVRCVASSRMRRSISCRFSFSSSHSRAIVFAVASSSASNSSTPRIARRRRPSALRRGARVKPTRPAVRGLPSSRAARMSARRPRFLVSCSWRRPSRTNTRFSPRSGATSAIVASATRSSIACTPDSSPPSRRVTASASLYATPTAARSLSMEGQSARRGLITANAGGRGPPGR